MRKYSFPLLVLGVITLVCLTFCSIGNATDTVRVWYGNVDGSPIWAFPGYPTRVDVWIQTGLADTVTGLHLCLGARDLYVESLITTQGEFEYPFAAWEDAAFVGRNNRTPPNPEGWLSQSFIGHSDTGGLANPELYNRFPKHYFSFLLMPKNDTGLIWDTIPCLNRGFDSYHGPTWAYGPSGPLIIVENFSPLNFVPVPESCIFYTNPDSIHLGGYVQFLIRYFKGIGYPPQPERLCYHPALPGDHMLFAFGDFNGDCSLSGADVIYLVGWFKGQCRYLRSCQLTPIKFVGP
jgi:hypothetical protein